jgi:anti-anti-sigma factor
VELEVRAHVVGTTPVVALGGTADLGSAPALHGALARLVIGHPGSVVAVDLDGLEVLDDTALGVILGAAGRARSAGGDLLVVTTGERIRARLSQTRFDRAVEVLASVSELAPLVESRRRRDLYHAAMPSDWDVALATGVYTVSTRGRSLDQVGFVHCSYRDQIEAVADRIYGDVDDLVLLQIDATRVTATIVDEPGEPSSTERFPHVYGPIDVDAVVEARLWRRGGDGRWRLPPDG